MSVLDMPSSFSLIKAVSASASVRSLCTRDGDDQTAAEGRRPGCWLAGEARHPPGAARAGDLPTPVTAFQPGGGPGKGEIDGYVDAGDDDSRGDARGPLEDLFRFGALARRR